MIQQDEQAHPSIGYSSYCQVDELIENARKTGRLDGITFGQKRDPCDTFYRKVKTMFDPVLPAGPTTSNIGVTIRPTVPSELERARDLGVTTDGRPLMIASTDNHSTKLLDAATLEPLGVVTQQNLHPALKGPMSGAHAARDSKTGDVFNYNLEFGAIITYRVFRASPTGKIDILAEISGLDIRGAYIHSISLTENFVILCIWPAYFGASGIPILWKRNILEAISPFDDKAKATWLVIDRRHSRGVVRKFKSEAFFCFHTTNAWEEQQGSDPDSVDIICELVQFKNTDILHRFYYENMVSDSPNVSSFKKSHAESTRPTLARYKLGGVPLRKRTAGLASSSTATSIMKISSSGDLPCINPRFATRPHRFVWSVLDRGKSSFMDGLGKTDTRDGSCVVWEKTNHTPSEPIFVPAPDAEREDEGVILTTVFDGDNGSTYLLCLNAIDMTELGRADVGKPVGFGFHGVHIPGA